MREIDAAAKNLEQAELTFDHMEAEYFAGTVTAEALRKAWDEREAARDALRRAHGAAA